MRIYLDVCCLSRPFDDLSQDRVRLETDAIYSIVSQAKERDWMLVGSDVVAYEIEDNPNRKKRAKVRRFASALQFRVSFSNVIVDRALELERLGFRYIDALHTASAEVGEADVLLTTDDQFVRKGIRHDTVSASLSQSTIRKKGLDALLKELGPVGMAKFLQDDEGGEGDYTKDRVQWQKGKTVKDFVREFKKKKRKSS
ncbi:MAG: PIN domain-containing protein [Bacteroidota bacterium]